MRTIITLLLMTFGLTAYEQDSAVAFNYQRDFRAIVEKTKDKTSDLYYQKLLIRFLDNDPSLTRAQTLALMIGYTENAHYKPFKDMETEKDIYDLNENGDYDEALVQSKAYLATHPLSLRILKERSFAYHETKKLDSAKYFMDLVDKVMNAMIYSGKGKKPEEPIFSLGLADGEWFIPNVGLTITGKNTAWNKNNNFMEVIDTVNFDGMHVNYYFVIQHAKDKIDDDEVNDANPKKPKKPSKKSNKKDNKQPKPVTDSIPVTPVN